MNERKNKVQNTSTMALSTTIFQKKNKTKQNASIWQNKQTNKHEKTLKINH